MFGGIKRYSCENVSQGQGLSKLAIAAGEPDAGSLAFGGVEVVPRGIDRAIFEKVLGAGRALASFGIDFALGVNQDEPSNSHVAHYSRGGTDVG